ncbi:MAG: hypothetical protein IJI97_10695 [Clostridia bacterium]|nr:hypothetical protein [Clostridia bacterium]MBR0205990.1 hypothetical protein [Clostridia bacterium]
MKKTSKTILLLLLALTMVLVITACQKPVEIQTQNPDGTLTVTGVLIEQTVTTVARILEALVLAYGAWALEKFGKNKKLQNLTLANQELCKIVKQTVRELNQTIVNKLKEESPDGKLTQEQISALNEELLALVKLKTDEATIAMIKASGADLDALITGQCEAYLDMLKTRQ